MKKWFFFLFSLPVFLISCSKSDETKCTFTRSNAVASAAEISYLQNYMTLNSIVATQHPSGLFYIIDAPGSVDTATICSNITVTYAGSLLLNGTVFDSTPTPAGTSLVLGQLIAGWQIGLPLIKTGGQITLYIPPSMGYGGNDRLDNQGNVIIPGNSYLKFTIHLLDVQ